MIVWLTRNSTVPLFCRIFPQVTILSTALDLLCHQSILPATRITLILWRGLLPTPTNSKYSWTKSCMDWDSKKVLCTLLPSLRSVVCLYQKMQSDEKTTQENMQLEVTLLISCSCNVFLILWLCSTNESYTRQVKHENVYYRLQQCLLFGHIVHSVQSDLFQCNVSWHFLVDGKKNKTIFPKLMIYAFFF